MIAWLDSILSLQSIIWLFLAAFILHDFEEIIVVEPWIKKNYQHLLDAAPPAFKRTVESFYDITSGQFAVAVLIEFIVFIPTTWFAAETDHNLLFLAFNVVLFLHVFTHLGQSLILKKYTPGVVTALVITLPYSLYLFYRLFQAGSADWQTLWISLPIGVVLLPIVLQGHKIGKKLVPNT
jgi:hypothetical protein